VCVWFFWISGRKHFLVSVFAELINITGTVEFSFVLLRKFTYDLFFRCRYNAWPWIKLLTSV
jgi:hypothetical protein